MAKGKTANPTSEERKKLMEQRTELRKKDKPTAADKKKLEEIGARLKELNAEKFKELAEARTTKAINAMRGIAKLSNRSNYAYSTDQVDKICEALRDEVLRIHDTFNRTPGEKQEGFKL